MDHAIRNSKSTFMLTLAILVASCGPLTSTSHVSIIGGRPLEPGDPGYRSTAAVLLPAGELCTATIVAKHAALTAAHCLETVPEGEPVSLYFGESTTKSRRPELTRRVTSFVLHPEYDWPNADLALVNFADGLPEGYAPAALVAERPNPIENLELRLVGYGDSDEDGTTFGQRLTVETKVHAFINTEKHRNLIIYGPTKMKGACRGDSGGPAFVQMRNEWQVVGLGQGPDTILSGNLECSAGQGLYTSVDAYLNWISATIRHKTEEEQDSVVVRTVP